MTLDEITALVATGESETLEFKSTTGTRREAVKTVCAMLNQRGGYVLFGVTPQGSVVGQQVGGRTLEEVSAEIQRIEPLVFPTVKRVRVAAGREVIVVGVNQGAARPYLYQGSAYRRVGSTTLAMSADEYQRVLFERMHAERRWENQAATGWAVEDLDVNEIRRTVEEAIRRDRLEDPGTREPAALLRGLGLLRDGVLWRAAVVLFGKDKRVEFDLPQCTLRVARFRGLDRTEFLDNRQFYGNAFTLLSSAERFLRDTLPIAGRIEPDRFERIDEPLYPPLAVREALANALCHRDYAGSGSVGVGVYDDRLEVTSPGSLHFGLTPERLFAPHESRPWNPLIARTFHRRGIIEEWGRGTLKMAELTTAAGLPRPEITEIGGGVMVCFRHGRHVPSQQAQQVERDMDERKQAILALLDRAAYGLAVRDIRAQLNSSVSARQVQNALIALRDQALVVSTGRGLSARWKRVRA